MKKTLGRAGFFASEAVVFEGFIRPKRVGKRFVRWLNSAQ